MNVQTDKQQGSRGYSLAELLTVVAIIGIISMVALPTFLQVIPQYRIRGVASEMAASLRLIRSKAVSTRTSYRMTVDPTADQYWLENEAVTGSGTWTPIGENGKPVASSGAWKKSVGVDLMPAGSNIIVTFDRGGTSDATSIVVGVNNSFVKFNRYTLNVQDSGNIAIVPSKV
jgi:prepilin-type N-terminal cleavage/methylation domain-containing protein